MEEGREGDTQDKEREREWLHSQQPTERGKMHVFGTVANQAARSAPGEAELPFLITFGAFGTLGLSEYK